MWCPLSDTDALAQLLERVYAEAFPGREVAERNAMLRALNVGPYEQVRHYERDRRSLRAISATRIRMHVRGRTE